MNSVLAFTFCHALNQTFVSFYKFKIAYPTIVGGGGGDSTVMYFKRPLSMQKCESKGVSYFGFVTSSNFKATWQFQGKERSKPMFSIYKLLVS